METTVLSNKPQTGMHESNHEEADTRMDIDVLDIVKDYSNILIKTVDTDE